MSAETTTWEMSLTEETLDLLSDNEHYAPAITLDPRDCTLSVDSEYGAGSGDGTPSNIWHNIVLQHWLPAVPDAKAIAEYLRSPEAAALLNRIADGHSVEWDGSNNVGRMTDDAAEAWGALTSHLDTLNDDRENAGIWDAGEWLDGSRVDRGNDERITFQYAMPDGSDMIITAETTDAELDAFATILDDDARRETVLLSGTYNYLVSLRDNL